MKASVIRMRLKSVRTKLLDIIRKYKGDIDRLVSDSSFSSFIFKQLKTVRELLSSLKKYNTEQEREELLNSIQDYLQASATYRDIISDAFNRLDEPPETRFDYTVHLVYLYLKALDENRPSVDAVSNAVKDYAEKGYIRYSTEQQLKYWAELGDDLAQYILDTYTFSIDRGYQQILNELLNILKYAYIYATNREDLITEHPTDVIRQLYEKGDIDSIPAIRNWLNSQLFSDYLPVVSTTIADILQMHPESVHLIAWYCQGISYKGRKTNFITVDNFSPDDERLGEILDQIQDKYNSGKSFTEIVEDLYPDKTFGEVLNLIIYVKRKRK